MDRDIMEGKWTELKGKLRSAYGDLTDDELEEARGDREQLEGKLQQRLGKSKDEVRQIVDNMLNAA
ncbi:CsbD family protein [Sagittula sp. S175]|uniref:CsbD family protein n=1 Tax=Sagittula sp. S175 TaxID=3415129 RepID=UPI003C7C2A7C